MLTELDKEIISDTEALSRFVGRRCDEVNLVDDDTRSVVLNMFATLFADRQGDGAPAE